MQCKADRHAAVPPQEPDEGLYAVMADLVALIDRVQASLRLLQAAQTQSSDPHQAGDVIVLDDVTALYAQASAALNACNAELCGALQFLIESTAPTRAEALPVP